MFLFRKSHRRERASFCFARLRSGHRQKRNDPVRKGALAWGAGRVKLNLKVQLGVDKCTKECILQYTNNRSRIVQIKHPEEI